MAILNMVYEGDPLLRKISRPVTEITPRITRLLDDMVDTMRHEGGCGLAAVQIGVLRRVVVIEVEEGQVIELINPRIVAYSGNQQEKEGCLSLPGKSGVTSRPAHVVVRGLNRHGEEVEYKGSDLLARAFCHELDHLDGKLYIDRLVGEVEETEDE